MSNDMCRRSEEEVRQYHQIAHEDPEAVSDGRVFCSCGWWSPIAPRAERMDVLARHVEHEVNGEEWCWGDKEKARKHYFEIESGCRRVPYGPDQSNIGAFVQDGKGHVFEIEDETPDGRHVVITTGHGDTTLDLELDDVFQVPDAGLVAAAVALDPRVDLRVQA
jgi:hypothetical protein